MKNSELTIQYIKNTYPCIQSWVDLCKLVLPNAMNYDAVSCAQLASISQATMKTLDYIVASDTNTKVVLVSRMLFELHETAWVCWTVFSSQSKSTTGAASISLTPSVIQGIATFAGWDSARDPSPSYFNPPMLLDTMLRGVTT